MTNHIVPVKLYLGIYLLLMVLLVLTVFAAGFQLGVFNVIAAMTIAAIKTALVGLYFMHVRDSARVVWVFVGAGVYWLAILLSLSMSDFVSRIWPPFGGQ